MSPDTVQIGPLVISKTVIDVLAPLSGTIIGGLITYFTTRAIEDRKWRQTLAMEDVKWQQQKADKLKEQQQQAFAQALEWIGPLTLAVMRVRMLANSFKANVINEQELHDEWPHLVKDLIAREIPTRLFVLLPTEIQDLSMGINLGIDNLKLILLDKSPQVSDEPWMNLCDQLFEKSNEYSKAVTDAYMKTYQ